MEGTTVAMAARYSLAAFLFQVTPRKGIAAFVQLADAVSRQAALSLNIRCPLGRGPGICVGEGDGAGGGVGVGGSCRRASA